MFHPSPALLIAQLEAVKTALDGGFIHVFSGPVPSAPGDALDMVADHTHLASFSVDGDGVTGLTFDAPTASPLQKSAAEVWKGLLAFDGAGDASTTLAPTFFRFCPDGDNGRTAGAGARLQGTCGGPSSGADMRFMADTVTANGLNELGVAIFDYSISSLA